MVPVYIARGLADGRHQELFALRVAGWGRWPAVAPRPAALLPRAYRPSAI